VVAYGGLPALAVVLGILGGFFKWQDSSMQSIDIARVEALQAAKDGAVALLSYQPGTVEKDLAAAQERLTGPLKESYAKMTNDAVIPGVKAQKISASASVPAAACNSATSTHAVALVYVNQTMIAGTGAPTDTTSSVRVTLDKVDGHWLIAAFDPL
jgi:Mce-associated membrane protein